MAEELARGEAAFVRCEALLGPQFTLRMVDHHGLREDYETARRAGFYRSVIEATVKADDWAHTPRGIAAMAAARAAVR